MNNAVIIDDPLAQAEASRIGELAVAPAKSIQARAIRLMELREATIHHINRIRAETARPMRKVRRLNIESATRRQLVGAKGLRP